MPPLELDNAALASLADRALRQAERVWAAKLALESDAPRGNRILDVNAWLRVGKLERTHSYMLGRLDGLCCVLAAGGQGRTAEELGTEYLELTAVLPLNLELLRAFTDADVVARLLPVDGESYTVLLTAERLDALRRA